MLSDISLYFICEYMGNQSGRDGSNNAKRRSSNDNGNRHENDTSQDWNSI